MTSAIAERRTAKAIESGLPEEAQGLLSDLTFQLSAHSTTQVDHILVAPHGIYVIEQKNCNVPGTSSSQKFSRH
ncbi:NERD domain-containing protein [Escherichia coli]|nr:NERD domain-containing protein [Escherichia coli]